MKTTVDWLRFRAKNEPLKFWMLCGQCTVTGLDVFTWNQVKRAFSDSDRPARSSCKIFRSVAWILAVSLKWVGFALTFLVRAVSGFRTGALLMPLKALRLHRFAVLILLLLPGMARSHMRGFAGSQRREVHYRWQASRAAPDREQRSVRGPYLLHRQPGGCKVSSLLREGI